MITNSRTPEVTEVAVKKIWGADADTKMARPKITFAPRMSRSSCKRNHSYDIAGKFTDLPVRSRKARRLPTRLQIYSRLYKQILMVNGKSHLSYTTNNNLLPHHRTPPTDSAYNPLPTTRQQFSYNSPTAPLNNAAAMKKIRNSPKE